MCFGGRAVVGLVLRKPHHLFGRNVMCSMFYKTKEYYALLFTLAVMYLVYRYLRIEQQYSIIITFFL